jgi:Protein of unknown function (DUF1592)/Protein of unknown function (DUF1588)/Protein of unknown function (DUF1587)/Protein of unknown function (DUF1585)/Protein of unknown function (DUF1595)/Planctomycete cytochrome C
MVNWGTELDDEIPGRVKQAMGLLHRGNEAGASKQQTARSLPPTRSVVCVGVFAVLMTLHSSTTAADVGGVSFGQVIQPILEEYCYACHGNGTKKGDVTLDGFTDGDARLRDHKLWSAVLKNVRSGIMPPAGKPRPTDKEQKVLEEWIKFGALGIDPQNPDPGRVTVRRLNRVEYRNTIRDLMGVDFDTNADFPPDDTGHGFDNIGDVLSISPLLLEKYITAAKSIVAQAVPTVSGVVAEKKVPGKRFRAADATAEPSSDDAPLSLSYYTPAQVSTQYHVGHEGRYQVVLDFTANERYVDNVFDYNKSRLSFKVDGKELLKREFSRQDGKAFHFEYDQTWAPGDHQFAIEVEPLTPNEKQVRSLAFRIVSVTVRGPFDERFWVRPPKYAQFFPKDVPKDPIARRQYARELLGGFAARACRRPVPSEMVNRLVSLAESVYTQGGLTFEAGVAHAMSAVLASPRFLYREEDVEAGSTHGHPFVDEYALASRLSYFLWSTMPDDELMRLAADRKLRANLSAQVSRMLADPKSREFFRHFVGQWLQARDVDTVLVNAMAVILRDEILDPEMEKRRARFRELNRKPPEKLTEQELEELRKARATFFGGFRRFREFELTGELRQAMKRETEMSFEHVVREDKSLLELLDSDYTFLNERLAKHYGIDGVKGPEMRRVTLPPGSPRGGILTQGTVLTVTSNPDRTSPVKRGLFILDNILGSPPPPPPPNIPALEEAGKRVDGRTPTLRETLQRHREQPSCNNCHNRLDPLGLALENFNALGRWRDKERKHPIDSTGKLITGEPFTMIQELKQILVTTRQRDFYRCLSEKMLTYALGRGLEDYDVQAVDDLVGRLEKANGGAQALLLGIVESTPFQKRRGPAGDEKSLTSLNGDGGPGSERAEPRGGQ